MAPYFRVIPPTTLKFIVSFPASEATITICAERGFTVVEGIEVTVQFISCVKFYDDFIVMYFLSFISLSNYFDFF